MPLFYKKDADKENQVPSVTHKNAQLSTNKNEIGSVLIPQRPVFYPRSTLPNAKRAKHEIPIKSIKWKENSRDIDGKNVHNRNCSTNCSLTNTELNASPITDEKRSKHQKIRFQESSISKLPEFKVSRTELATVIESRMLEPQICNVKRGEKLDPHTIWTKWNDQCWISDKAVLLNPRSIKLEDSTAYKYSPHTFVVQPAPSLDT